MKIGIVEPQLHESLIDLLCEVNAYYNPDSPASRVIVQDHVVQNLLASSSPHILVVASTQAEKVLGLAAISLAYSLVEPELDRRKHLLLKELFVSRTARSQRVGLALMNWIAAFAIENGCHRIDWPVKASNHRGQAFYRKLGATLVENRLSFRITEPDLTALANNGVAKRGA